MPARARPHPLGGEEARRRQQAGQRCAPCRVSAVRPCSPELPVKTGPLPELRSWERIARKRARSWTLTLLAFSGCHHLS